MPIVQEKKNKIFYNIKMAIKKLTILHFKHLTLNTAVLLSNSVS